ncbi:hypothetical protein EJB05_56552, partial [Eragrostis curvula]
MMGFRIQTGARDVKARLGQQNISKLPEGQKWQQTSVNHIQAAKIIFCNADKSPSKQKRQLYWSLVSTTQLRYLYSRQSVMGSSSSSSWSITPSENTCRQVGSTGPPSLAPRTCSAVRLPGPPPPPSPVISFFLKPGNILLEASLGTKLGDFGLAQLLDRAAPPRTTWMVAGTMGYMDPDLVHSCQPSTASDVYSFGVSLLEQQRFGGMLIVV